MNFIQPSIDPVIISFGFVDIRWYSLAYILGLIIGLVIMKRLNKFSNNFLLIVNLYIADTSHYRGVSIGRAGVRE